MESKGAIVGAVLASGLLHLAVGATGWPRLERVTALPPAPAAPVEVELAPLALPSPAAPRLHAPSPAPVRPRPTRRVPAPEPPHTGNQPASSRPSAGSQARTPPRLVRMATGMPAPLSKPLDEPGPGRTTEPQRAAAPSLRTSLRPGAPAEAPIRPEPETSPREPAREDELPEVRGTGGSGSLRLAPRGGEGRPGLPPGLGMPNPLGSPGTGSSAPAKPAGSGDGPGDGETRSPNGPGKGAGVPGGGTPRGGTGAGGAERPRPPIQNPPERPSAPAIPPPAPAPLRPEVPPAKPASVEPLVQAKARYRRNPAPDYPDEAWRLRQEGVVLLRVQVNARGRVDEAEVERSSGSPSLDQAATRAVRRWEFEPARRGDTPVASTVTVPVRFRLERE